jgi:hypothetical protein
MSAFVPTFDLVAILQRDPPAQSPLARVENESRTEWGIIIAVGPGPKDHPLPFQVGDVVVYSVKNCEKVMMPSSAVHDGGNHPSMVPVTYVRAPNIYAKLTNVNADI